MLVFRCVVCAMALCLAAPSVQAEQAAHPRIALKEVDSWGYQLQNVVPRLVAKDGFDVLVVDYSRDGTDSGAMTPADVARLRRREGQPDRIVLAYLSIGEAEDYRYYWRSQWSDKQSSDAATGRNRGFAGAPNGNVVSKEPLAKLTDEAPAWLADENPEWRGNYLVRYWDEQWQGIIFGAPDAYLDKILAAGFDGVYLDKVDANDDWQATRPTAEREMADFVKKLASYARERRPGFLIVPQNGEELLEFPDYVRMIDAIAKEDLLFGGNQRKDGEANPEAEIAKSKRHLDKALRGGRRVLAVEYLEHLDSIVAAQKRLKTYGYVPLFARRALDEGPRTLEASK